MGAPYIYDISRLRVKIVLFTIKWAKIILLLQFSRSQSVWWPYIQSVCWCYCCAGPVCWVQLSGCDT